MYQYFCMYRLLVRCSVIRKYYNIISYKVYRHYTGTSATAQIGSSAFYCTESNRIFNEYKVKNSWVIHSLTVPLCSVHLVLSKIFIYSESTVKPQLLIHTEYFLLYIEVKYEFSAVKKN